MNTCKILTWNIRQGGKKKKENIIASLVLHNADIIVLTEYRENATGEFLKKEMQEHGWEFFISSCPPANENGVLLLSKFPLEKLENGMRHTDGGHRQNAVYCPNFDLVILGSHVPNVNETYDKTLHWQHVTAYADKMEEKKCVIIGDFNTALRQEKTKAPKKYSDFINGITEKGWVDAWKVFHQNCLDYTWYSNTNNGYRLDYAFLSPALSGDLLVCYHSHRERIRNFSDHSIVILELISR